MVTTNSRKRKTSVAEQARQRTERIPLPPRRTSSSTESSPEPIVSSSTTTLANLEPSYTKVQHRVQRGTNKDVEADAVTIQALQEPVNNRRTFVRSPSNSRQLISTSQDLLEEETLSLRVIEPRPTQSRPTTNTIDRSTSVTSTMKPRDVIVNNLTHETNTTDTTSLTHPILPEDERYSTASSVPTAPDPSTLHPDDDDDGNESDDESVYGNTDSDPDSILLSQTHGESITDSLEECADKIADHLFELLCVGNIGCSPATHQQDLDAHIDENAAENCYDLSSTYDPLMSFLAGVLAKSTDVGFRNTRFPTPLGVGRGNFARSSLIRPLMEGRHDDDELPRNVCLHTEYRPVTQPVREYDTDSVIVFSDNLKPIRSNIEVTFTRITSMNITADMHVTRNIYHKKKNGKITRGETHVRDLPHLYLGTIRDLPSSSVFRVFPFLTSESGSNWLTERDTRRYLDEIWIPACRKSSSEGVKQYLPPSWKIAEEKASAKQKEHLSSTNSRGRVMRTYPLQAMDFDRIEEAADAVVNDPHRGLNDFRSSFIVVSTKNIKLDLRHNGLWSAMEQFDHLFDRLFDRQRVTLYSDVAVEVIPASPSTTAEAIQAETDSLVGAQRAVYLWKACCLKTIVQSLRTQLFGGKRGAVKEFNNVFLRDSKSVSIVPPMKSIAKRGGLHYVQCYIVEKAFEDANSVRPFDKTEIVNLAIADALYRAAKFPQSRGSLERNYLAAKRRLASALETYRGSSTGARLEARINQLVRDALKDRAFHHDHPLSSDLDFLWVLPMTTWLDFKAGNFEKILSLIDVIIMSQPTTGVTNGTAQLLFLLFTYLQNLSNCDPQRKSLLWKDRVEIDDVMMYGAGLGTTIQQHGFGWMLPIIDWERFCPRPEVEHHIVSIDKVIGVCYRGHDAVRLTYDARTLMEICYDALRVASPGSRDESSVMNVMASFVLRSYRRDVWDILCPTSKSEVREEYKSPEARDQTQFCWDALTDALVKPPLLVSGNRAGGTFNPDEIFRWVMTDLPGRKRDHFDTNTGNRTRKPFRDSLHEIWDLTRQKSGQTHRWNDVLRQTCMKYMWMLPVPDGNGALTCCKSKQHKFMSTRVSVRGEWVWARKDVRRGRPPAWPATLSMTPTELRHHLGALTA